jgi:hypothetical protein
VVQQPFYGGAVGRVHSLPKVSVPVMTRTISGMLPARIRGALRGSGMRALIALGLLLPTPVPAHAHEVPASVTIRAFVRPEPGRVRLLVRVPLEAMRDIAFPLYGEGYLDLAQARPLLMEAAELWLTGSLGIRENGRALPAGRVVAATVSLPSDPSFARYDAAIARVLGPVPAGVDLPWQQALLDVLIEYAASAADAEYSIVPAVAHLGLTTTTVVRFVPYRGAERVYQFAGDPGAIRLDPRWHHAALHFVRLGFRHILEGLDHLLFLLCLLIPVRRFRPLLVVVTSFTVAHSLTLVAAAVGFAPRALWFPPLIETLIALSIVYMAFENIVGARIERRWAMAFIFGLVHGFGFSFMLRESLQFAGPHLLTALLAFNVGVELGQVVVIACAVPLLAVLFRRVVAERVGTILLSALVAHSAWHWMTERAADLRRYPLQWPAADMALAVAAARAALLVTLGVGAMWLIRLLAARLARGQATSPAAAGEGG